ncbi:MAG TPA: bifunctional DNA-formamidopyrimidine glycosylase/DNA-(apurinic or apyrimidinic site) lyase [Patescibacteria group bacterium]|nr:bifunctional DNA-formamidopyrimidine glycosylase/DNA-(apurinic or apyrimidinic site) lyase [Patescibacteria group bacterium]
MPELPEVETIRRDLQRLILHKKIVQVQIRPKARVFPLPKKFIQLLINTEILSLNRRGKLLFGQLANGQYLLVHLKMTGQLIYRRGDQRASGGHEEKDKGETEKYNRIRIVFADGSELLFNDLRRFGYWRLVSEIEKERVLAEYGWEPLGSDFSFVRFSALSSGRSTTIKSLLLDQKLIAGLGNIYAAEVCFSAGILPTRSAKSLSAVEQKKLWQNIRRIMRLAVKKRGTTFANYRDARGRKGNFVPLLCVYGRRGQTCLRCRRAQIQEKKISGRTTAFCPFCQK